MTTKPKSRNFRIRRSAPSESMSRGAPGRTAEDGFGDRPFPGSAKAERPATGGSDRIAEIRQEGLTGRQLRMARRLAQKHGLEPASDFDAVRLLRANGIDPFDRANLIKLVSAKKEAANAPPASTPPKSAAKPTPNLPQKVDTEVKNLPGAPAPKSSVGLHELERIQRDIAKRRRRKTAFLAARLFAFVLAPTALAWMYYAFVATPIFATKSEFIVQQAEAQAAAPGLLGGTALAASQDSIMVQDFLKSREAMLRLDADHDFRTHFSDPSIDWFQRVEADASNEALYAHYQDSVRIGFDPTEGVIRMEVSALSPEASRVFSEALIGYAEERVDSVTERMREDQMQGARESFDEAEAKMIESQERVLTLQQQLGVVDPASETSALMSQIGTFEVQLAEKRLQLQQLLDNAQPNQARVSGVQGDIDRLEDLISDLRAQLTVEDRSAGSLASVSAQLRMAEVDLETRTMIMQEALQHMEAARIEAMRQVRFLSISVAPIPPDEPTYPKVLENTLIAFFVLAGIYLLLSITVAVLRDQVSN